jgi:glycosyltransferase involved in cell wall biosynthesis
MRICLVSQEYPPETAHGGIGAQTYLKANGLARRGHDVVVLSHSIDSRRHDQMIDGVRIVRIPPPDIRLSICSEAARWIAHSQDVAAELEFLKHEAGFDLVDFPEWGCEAYFHLVNRDGAMGPTTVIQLHGPLVMFAERLGWPDRESLFYRICSQMERMCLAEADAIFSSSRCSADWVERAYGLDAAAIPVLHTGVDLALFRPVAVERDLRPTLLFVGKLARNKGVDLLLDAALELAPEYPGLRLRLIGRGDASLVESLRDRAARAGSPDLLEIAGFVDRAALPAELCKADIFAAPSAYEGGPGFVYLEAMACGLPVVGCAGSGASEAIRDGVNGMLVSPGSVGELAAALRRMLGDPELRAKLGASGLAQVRAEAEGEACLDQLELYYRKLVERGR